MCHAVRIQNVGLSENNDKNSNCSIENSDGNNRNSNNGALSEPGLFFHHLDGIAEGRDRLSIVLAKLGGHQPPQHSTAHQAITAIPTVTTISIIKSKHCYYYYHCTRFSHYDFTAAFPEFSVAAPWKCSGSPHALARASSRIVTGFRGSL